jgi:hypothetical protein
MGDHYIKVGHREAIYAIKDLLPYVNATVRLIINADDEVDIHDMLNEMEYNFTSNTDNANIIEEEVMDFQVKFAK